MQLDRKATCKLNKQSMYVQSTNNKGDVIWKEEVTYLPCDQLNCQFFTHIRGNHPQTGELIDEYDCVFCWLPILLIENSQQTRQAGAAVESFRNEMVKVNENNQMRLQSIPQNSQFLLLT